MTPIHTCRAAALVNVQRQCSHWGTCHCYFLGTHSVCTIASTTSRRATLTTSSLSCVTREPPSASRRAGWCSSTSCCRACVERSRARRSFGVESWMVSLQARFKIVWCPCYYHTRGMNSHPWLCPVLILERRPTPIHLLSVVQLLMLQSERCFFLNILDFVVVVFTPSPGSSSTL